MPGLFSKIKQKKGLNANVYLERHHINKLTTYKQ